MIAHKQAGWLHLATFFCLLAAACGDSGDNPSNQSVGPAAQGDAAIGPGPVGSTTGGAGGVGNPPLPGMAGGGTVGGGIVGGATAGGGTTGGGGITGGGNPLVDAGAPGPALPPDLGQDSAGDSFFRADTMVLRTPNLFLKILFETNITAAGQDALNATLINDDDMNGFVDMSLVLRFVKTKMPSMADAQLTPGGALCPIPVDPARACSPDPTFPFYAPAVAYSNAQNCMLLGTQETAAGACFASTPASIVIQLPILGAVPLQDGQVIGSWDGTGISNGRVRGFLPKTVAAVTKLGDGLPEAFALLGIQKGAPLTDFLSDRELTKNARGEDGWWFLVNYSAKPISFDPNAK